MATAKKTAKAGTGKQKSGAAAAQAAHSKDKGGKAGATGAKSGAKK